MQWSFQWEEKFLLFLQEHVRSPWLDKCMNAVTRLGDAGFVAILACLVMLAIPAMRWAGRLAAMSLLMDFLVVNVILKNLVGRVRPYGAIEGLLPIARLPADASFPSGHAGACFAVAGVLFWLAFYPGKYPGAKKPGRALKAAGVMAMVLACLIGFSRLYVGVHYPTDVLAGAAIGLFTSWFAVTFGKDFRWGKRGSVPE